MPAADAFPTSFEPLAGGFSGETFLAGVGAEEAVVRIYGPRSAWRGPLAPEVDAAVLELVHGLLPVGHMAEPRRGVFVGRSLRLGDLPPGVGDLPAWLEHH